MESLSFFQSFGTLDRNKDIVDETDVLLAFPSTKFEQLRSGTWSTVRYGRKKNKSIVLIYPDGDIDSSNSNIKIAKKKTMKIAKRTGTRRKP